MGSPPPADDEEELMEGEDQVECDFDKGRLEEKIDDQKEENDVHGQDVGDSSEA